MQQYSLSSSTSREQDLISFVDWKDLGRTLTAVGFKTNVDMITSVVKKSSLGKPFFIHLFRAPKGRGFVLAYDELKEGVERFVYRTLDMDTKEGEQGAHFKQAGLTAGAQIGSFLVDGDRKIYFHQVFDRSGAEDFMNTYRFLGGVKQ